MRPNGYNLNDMLWIADYIAKSDQGYLKFMIHSSELSAHCNPRFITEEQINKLYSDIEKVFDKVSEKYQDETIGDYIKNLHYKCKK